jgi:hypothetical protein
MPQDALITSGERYGGSGKTRAKWNCPFNWPLFSLGMGWHKIDKDRTAVGVRFGRGGRAGVGTGPESFNGPRGLGPELRQGHGGRVGRLPTPWRRSPPVSTIRE